MGVRETPEAKAARLAAQAGGGSPEASVPGATSPVAAEAPHAAERVGSPRAARACAAPGGLRAAVPRNAEHHRVKFSGGLPVEHVAARNAVSKSPIFGLSELLRAGIPPGNGQRDVVHRNYCLKSKLERKGTQIEPIISNSYKHVLAK